jgi:hypothetical protein
MVFAADGGFEMVSKSHKPEEIIAKLEASINGLWWPHWIV